MLHRSAESKPVLVTLYLQGFQPTKGMPFSCIHPEAAEPSNRKAKLCDQNAIKREEIGTRDLWMDSIEQNTEGGTFEHCYCLGPLATVCCEIKKRSEYGVGSDRYVCLYKQKTKTNSMAFSTQGNYTD
jgi:hypothetical protein